MHSRNGDAYRLSASFVLGYHGCSNEVAERLLAGKRFRRSNNAYDWLGSGIYFWEANPKRALEFAGESRLRTGKSKDNIAVVGAVIDLGYCLDLLSSASIEVVRQAYDGFEEAIRMSGRSMPKNLGGEDLLLRHLDCAVINYLHEARKDANEPSFDSVRGLFVEGNRIYDKSGFREKTHIQICVRKQRQLKGVFRVSSKQMR